MAYTREEIATKTALLPENLRDFLTSEAYTNALGEIRKLYNLQIDELAALSEVTEELFYGDLLPQDFSERLVEALEIPADKAKAITGTVNEKIFLPIREELKKVYGKEKTADELHPLPVNKQEAKEHVLGAIEEPEKVPMKITLVTKPAISPFAIPTPTPKAPEILKETASVVPVNLTTSFAPPPARVVAPELTHITPLAPAAQATTPETKPAPVGEIEISIPIKKLVTPPPRVTAPATSSNGVPLSTPIPSLAQPPAPTKPLVPKPTAPARTANTPDPYREITK